MSNPKTVMPGPARRNGFRSNWEGEYAEHLKQLRASKEILSWAYEPIRLRIASNNFYTPDFLVCTDREIQFHEVKGLQREASMLRLRTASYQHRWARFYLIQKTKAGWSIEEII
jgi:hypothetical protein